MDLKEPRPLETVFVTSENDIIAYDDMSFKYFISKDGGASWENFFSSPFQKSYDDHLFREDNENHLYYSNGYDKIYKYDEIDSRFNLYLKFLYGSIDDFLFHINNDLVISNDQLVQIYNGDQKLKKQLEWDLWQSYLVPTDEEINYVVDLGSDDRLIGFNSNLDTFHLGFFDAWNESKIKFNKGRLFRPEHYSDDGVNWFNYNQGAEGTVGFLNNGTVYIAKDQIVFTSSDNGDNFESHELPFAYNGFDWTAVFPYDSSGVVLYDYSPRCKEQTFVLQNGQVDWNDRTEEMKLGASELQWFKAINEENFFYIPCNSEVVFEHPLLEEPMVIDSLNGSDCQITAITLLSNGHLITNQCLSKDGGLSWETTIEDDNYNFISEKENIVLAHHSYHPQIANGDFMFSLDFGQTWETFPFWEEFPGEVAISDYDVSSNQFIYVFTTLNWNDAGKVYKLDFEENIISEHEIPSSSPIDSGPVTSFSGDKVYLMENDNIQDNIYLYSSLDGGSTYQYQNIFGFHPSETIYCDMRTDRLGGIYVFCDNELWVSYDDGFNWRDISPEHPDLIRIENVQLGSDDHLYLHTLGSPILKSSEPVKRGQKLEILVFEDTNGNCIKDEVEVGLGNVKVKVLDDWFIITDKEGKFNTTLPAGRYDIDVEVDENLFEVCGNVDGIELTSNDSIFSFAVSPVETCANLKVAVSTSNMRGCNSNLYFIELFNAGSTEAADVTLNLELDVEFEFTSSEMDLISSQGNEYVFSLANIPPLTHTRYQLFLKHNCDIEGDSRRTVKASVIYGDACSGGSGESTNIEHLRGEGSNFDKVELRFFVNDSLEYSSLIFDVPKVDESDKLEYSIRFQNEGSEPVNTIVLTDKFNDYFDVSSIKPIIASHDYNWSLDKNVLKVEFDDINLQPKSISELTSVGFFKFEISLKENYLLPGDPIVTKAHISFDSQPSVVSEEAWAFYKCEDVYESMSVLLCPGEDYEGYTDEGVYRFCYQTEMGCDSTVVINLKYYEETDPECLESNIDDLGRANFNFTLSPNPANQIVHIQAKGELGQSRGSLLDLHGRHVKAFTMFGNYHSLSLENLTPGIYFIELRTEDQRLIKKLNVIPE